MLYISHNFPKICAVCQIW